MKHTKKLAILVGGGPAPGINSVIGAAAIEALLDGVEVVGIRDGFEWIQNGDTDHVMPLNFDNVSRIHLRGGSHIGISRANPTKKPELLENTIVSLLKLNADKLITIGGDDTAHSAMRLSEKSTGRIQVVHVPKTIDNDLDLPPQIDTFGYQTARHIGVEIVKNLMVDARTTSRWYFVIAMGRSAGHLALGIGNGAGATLTLIPEEFKKKPIPFKDIVDTLVGAIIKRLSNGRRHGVAVIAEGVALRINPDDMTCLACAEKDAHGNLRLAEIDFGLILKKEVEKALAEFHLKTTIVAKNIGYELRCADPIPFDMEYTRDLGCCAARYILSGGTDVMVSMQAGKFVPIPFKDMLDPVTGKARIRHVDTDSARYAIARRYMIRLRSEDFEDEYELSRIAAAAGMQLGDFKKRFSGLLESEPAKYEMSPSPEF